MSVSSFKLIKTADDLRAACERLASHSAIGFDTETTSLDPYNGRLRLIQLAAPDEPTSIIDLDAFRRSRYSDLAKDDALAPLRALLASSRPIKSAHNAKFDAKWIKHELGVETNGLFDTLLASQLISGGDTEDRHNLAAVAARYLDETIDKSQQLSNWGGELSTEQLEYAARDASVMIPLREKLIERLKGENLIACAALEFECVMPIAALELDGIFLDAARWREQMKIVEAKRAALAEELQNMLAEGASQGLLFANARQDINLDSHTQLAAALKRLGVPVPDSTRNWKLQPLAKKYPVVEKLLEYRTVQKSLTSYGENILTYINPKTHRIHAHFHQIGAPTGRMSCTDPNIQQVPHDVAYRRCFRAPEKRKLIIADYCVAKGTRVATERGLILIEEMELSDLVCLENGSATPISAIIRRGKLPIIKLTLRNGYSFKATELHRIRVIDFAGNYVWRRIGELQETDFVVIQPARGISRRKDYETLPDIEFNHHNNCRFQAPKLADENLGLFFGYVCGDGSYSERSIKWVVNQQDADLAQQMDELAANLFGLEIHRRPPYRGVFESMINSTPLISWCKNLNIGKDCVPDFLWRSKDSVMSAFLRGLFEADGSVTDNCTGKVSFATSREVLARQVHQLLLALGITATLRRQNETGPGKKFNCWIISIVANGLQKFADEIGFISLRKRRKLQSLLASWTGKTVVGNMPNLRAKILALKLSGEARRLLNNTSSINRPISTALAYTIEQNYPTVAENLNLKHLTEYKQLFLPVVSIENVGEEEVFDLSVPGAMTYISDGFISHNSQIELRILADITGDEGFIRAFQTGADFHRTTAAQVFNVAPEDVTADQRSFAKRLNFGVVYGIGAQRFAMLTGSSVTEAEELLRRYFATYPQLDAWLREAARRAVRERAARTLAGRLARFNFDPEDRQAVSAAQRNGKNFPIQGSSADILKRALRLLHNQLQNTMAELVNVVHDEIVVETNENGAEEIAKCVEAAMCAAGEEFIKKVPVKVESVIADEWVK